MTEIKPCPTGKVDPPIPINIRLKRRKKMFPEKKSMIYPIRSGISVIIRVLFRPKVSERYQNPIPPKNIQI